MTSIIDDTDQRARVADALDTTLFVNAGAGSGKTTALVGRIVRLVVTGEAELHAVAAITFTEAAAAELRDRLREALERVAAGEAVQGAGPGGEAVEPDNGERARADAALREIDAATISTLHGFAQRILTSHAIDAGLPPRLHVFDALSSAVAFAQRWDQFVTTLLDDPVGQELVVRARFCGVRINQLRDIAQALNDNWDLVADHRPPALGSPLPILGGELRRLLREATGLEDDCTSHDDKLLTHLQGLRPFITALDETDDGLALLRLLDDAPRLRSGYGQKGNWPDVAHVRDILLAAQVEADRIIEATGRDVLAHLLVILRRLTLDAADERRRAGRLEFHDLLVRARNLLRERHDVCDLLRRRWTHLLVDEFQDTDPIQAELAMRIAGTDTGEGPWRDFAIGKGQLFFVGDPKQAIYRFRRADIELFMDMQQIVGGQGERLSLTRCFRSVPSIVAWVNAVFLGLLGEGDGNRQPPYDPLVATRDDHGPDPAVIALGGAIEDADLGAIDDVRAAAADDIARLIRRARAEEWPVGDDARPLRLADVAILVPTSAEVPALEHALSEHQIPYRLEASSSVFGSAEVADLLHALRAIDDPGDELSLVAALRSPLYGCGDDDLVAWRLAGGRWDYTASRPDDPNAAVAAAFDHLRSLHDDLRWTDPPTIVERLLAERRALALALDIPRTRDAWRRLHWVADQARAYVEQGGADLRGWLGWMDTLADSDARTREAMLPETDDEAVRILTVHSSKGLEFPMVILSGLLQRPRAESGTQVLWGDHGPEVAISGGLRTGGFDELATREAVLSAHERLRLLYVAATRAQDHLIVPLHHQRGTECHAATLCGLHDDGGFEGPWRTIDLDGWDPEAPTEPETPAPIGVRPSDRVAWIEARTAALTAASRPRSVSATRLAEEAAAADEEHEAEEVDADQPAWRRGRGGTAVGRAVHGTLQLVDLAAPTDVDEVARFQAEAEGVGGRAREVARLARHALDSELIARAARARYWKETYVGVPIGDRVLEGFIDLLVDDGEGFTVIDYKTALGASDEDLDRRAAGYEVQGAAYAVAIEEIADRPVDRCVFLFLREDGAVERTVDDLDAAKRRVRALIG